MREVIGNVFSAYFQNNQGASGITLTGNYFGGNALINTGYTAPWASFSGNFVRFPQPCMAGTRFGAQGSMSQSYFYSDGDCNNTHWISVADYTGQTFDGLVFDAGGDTGYGDANVMLRNGSDAITLSLTHTVTPQSAAGFSSGAPVVTLLEGGIKDGQWTVEHNAIMTHGLTDAAVDTETLEPSAGQLASLRSNLIGGWRLFLLGTTQEAT